MTEYLITAIALAILCIIVKQFFWLKIPQRRVQSFFLSFFRWYSVYDIHDAPSDESKKFRNKSNFLNFIFWLSAIVIVLIVLFTPTEIVNPKDLISQ